MTTQEHPRTDTKYLTQDRIDYLELRPHCDVLYISGREVPLFGLTEEAGLGKVNYVRDLLTITDKVATVRFGFDIGSEGRCIGRVTVHSGDLLAIARYAERFNLRTISGGASA